MKITKEAIEFFYRIFFSCYIPCKVYEDNEKVFQIRVAENSDMEFDYFCEGLQEWDSRKKAILELTKQGGKNFIDKEVITEYFGGSKHTEVVVESLREENVPVDGNFYPYAVFNHMLIPVVIKNISQKHPVITAVYENNGMSIEIRGILFYEQNRKDISVGKTVLCHYPMMVDENPTQSMIELLFSCQKDDDIFMEAARSLRDGVDHVKFPFLNILRKRMKI